MSAAMGGVPDVTPTERSGLIRNPPLYLVVFVGFLGYSLMITVFTPMILHNDNGMLAASSSTAERTIILGVLLSLYPLPGNSSVRRCSVPCPTGSVAGRCSWPRSGQDASATPSSPRPSVREPLAALRGVVLRRPDRGQHLDRPKLHRRHGLPGRAQPPVRLRVPQRQHGLRDRPVGRGAARQHQPRQLVPLSDALHRCRDSGLRHPRGHVPLVSRVAPERRGRSLAT